LFGDIKYIKSLLFWRRALIIVQNRHTHTQILLYTKITPKIELNNNYLYNSQSVKHVLLSFETYVNFLYHMLGISLRPMF